MYKEWRRLVRYYERKYKIVNEYKENNIGESKWCSGKECG
jgi:hypothetical protein